VELLAVRGVIPLRRRALLTPGIVNSSVKGFFVKRKNQSSPTVLRGSKSIGARGIHTAIPFVSRQKSRISRWARRRQTELVLMVLLACGAVLMAASLANHGRFWLCWASLVPLFVVVRLLSPIRAAIWTGCWGLAVGLLTLLFESTVAPDSVQRLALLFLFPALFGWGARRMTIRFGFQPIVMGFGWMLVELGLQFTTLEGGFLIAAGSDNPLTVWIGQTLGFIWIALLISMFSAIVLSIVADLPMPRCPSARRIRRANRIAGFVIPFDSSLRIRCFLLRMAAPRAPPIFALQLH